MANSSRGISQQSNSTVVTTKTPSVQLDPSASNFMDALARYQAGVADTIDSVLDWLNSHFSPAPPTRSANGRAVTPDDTTLVLADGTTLNGTQTLSVALPVSQIVAGTTKGTLINVALPANDTWSLTEIDVYCPTPSAGTASLLIGSTSIVLSGYQHSVLATVPSFSQTLPVQYTASSNWAATGVISLTFSVGVLT